MTTKEIKKSNPAGKMTMVSGTNEIRFDNGVIFDSIDYRAKNTLWNKLIKMGYERHYNLSSDEIEGLAEAGRRGENPFTFTILSA